MCSASLLYCLNSAGESGGSASAFEAVFVSAICAGELKPEELKQLPVGGVDLYISPSVIPGT
jgi:hypothetical protein